MGEEEEENGDNGVVFVEILRSQPLLPESALESFAAPALAAENVDSDLSGGGSSLFYEEFDLNENTK